MFRPFVRPPSSLDRRFFTVSRHSSSTGRLKKTIIYTHLWNTRNCVGLSSRHFSHKSCRLSVLLPRRDPHTLACRNNGSGKFLSPAMPLQGRRHYGQIVPAVIRFVTRYGPRVFPKAMPFIILGLTRVLPLLALVAGVGYVIYIVEGLPVVTRRIAYLSVAGGSLGLWLAALEWAALTGDWQIEVVGLAAGFAGTDDLAVAADTALYKYGDQGRPIKLMPRKAWLRCWPSTGLEICAEFECVLGPTNTLCAGHSVPGKLIGTSSFSFAPTSSSSSSSSSFTSSTSSTSSAVAADSLHNTQLPQPWFGHLRTSSLVFEPIDSNQDAATRALFLDIASTVHHADPTCLISSLTGGNTSQNSIYNYTALSRCQHLAVSNLAFNEVSRQTASERFSSAGRGGEKS
eukprot:g150.t1